MITVALTGSIGMGKSTVAAMFADLGIPVWSADDAVARAYAKDGAGVAIIRDLAPEAVRGGTVDRGVLRRLVAGDKGLLQRIEVGIHPLVWEDRAAFRAAHKTAKAGIFEIPLLFETSQHENFDRVIVVSAGADVQKKRVLARAGMTEAGFDYILSKQVPDAEKRAAAGHVIDTSIPIDETRDAVTALARKWELI